MEHAHGPASRKHLEAFASLRGAPAASHVKDGWSEAYGTEEKLRRSVHRLLQKRVMHLECLRLWTFHDDAQVGRHE